MGQIVSVFSLLQDRISSFAGFGIDDSHSVASFCVVVSLALFGAVCLNHLSERHDNVHLAFNVVAMFAGGVIGNALLRTLHLPLGNELVLTTTLALFGMSVMAVILLLAYRRTEF
ncbi:MAG TPA: hypothetical protein VMN43_06450 [Aestuariivirgaceae bacterium]|jgi:hypothetical protein|nr:hypothetical protein [Aestuariivirgaceae bacterium]